MEHLRTISKIKNVHNFIFDTESLNYFTCMYLDVHYKCSSDWKKTQREAYCWAGGGGGGGDSDTLFSELLWDLHYGVVGTVRLPARTTSGMKSNKKKNIKKHGQKNSAPPPPPALSMYSGWFRMRNML